MCRKVPNHGTVKCTGNRLPLIGMARDSITARGIARILIYTKEYEELPQCLKHLSVYTAAKEYRYLLGVGTRHMRTSNNNGCGDDIGLCSHFVDRSGMGFNKKR